MICGRIILLIITKYIAYYHIAELYAHASIVSTYVGLERCVKYFIENTKISYVAHCLFLCCISHATHSMVPSRDGLETGIIIFAIAFTIFAVMGWPTLPLGPTLACLPLLHQTMRVCVR